MDKPAAEIVISVITVTYNSAEFVGDTIRSVNEQDHPNIEHVFVDGGSTDGTIEIIEQTSTRPKVVISEPDNGPYDAMNKGIRAATGDVIGILNSDDVYASSQVVSEYCDAFATDNVDVVYRDICIVDRSDPTRVRRRWQTGDYSPGAFRRGWHPPHPAFYVTRRAYRDCGLYRSDLEISADFELMLRMLETCRLKVNYMPGSAVVMRSGGLSTRSLRNVLRGNFNIVAAFKLNGQPVSWLYMVNRLLRKTAMLIAPADTVNIDGS